ncbi:MAG: transcriptional regulator NrdR [Verrucomicrobia bacterium CG_4_10_14_3_um_filter_43_23]|nr:MAG: transcriptional regulator NrdR [Verrucomicrobia bacterium CG1_02_43_26]PIP59384.1 MAG: transcriptional regulator NrdR [Verrucomicrobia bacterium CG22_combo_CG10-13_8_21_14_all_43_17]PIX58493.1 MAG: transcriptional regulator NrdR [Verrucomicrobia bacterium CG_4_10_14_3_um_filter_43_23]PIY62242.1 MAG: transcriptional regulator NrdR [Verrucomicrobia bacterium CG_4_10_14_0_8_um_filter_43_34]PJA44294.1 MAG: transcriptional regulator NrdR [Verrucomicrobia bacterium CG_4_9_14_3_um_filter_43_20
MRCPKCLHPDTKVVDSRSNKDNTNIRRRRQCPECSQRFSTLEETIREGLVVTKRDGRREDYDRTKIINGIKKAAQKRPINIEQIERITSAITDRLQTLFEAEIPSVRIGEEIMNQLKQVDKIAYVRFASVYKDFRDITELAKEIHSLNDN